MTQGIYGDTTRGLNEAWSKRVRSANTIPAQLVQPLFNDIQLFPAQSQVFEMLHCARECTNRDSDKFLTFGEFCVFATELRKYYNQHETATATMKQSSGGQSKSTSPVCASQVKTKKASELRTQKSSQSVYDVFLGGSCNPTTWRQDVAIPHLKGQGITYYNPQQSNWVPEMIELEHQAKQTSQILFFVLNDMTRNVVSMIEVSLFAGSSRKLVVVINPYPAPGHKINGDVISEAEFNDLNGALTTVTDLVERQGIPVFNSINVALSCTSRLLKENLSLEELGPSVQPVRLAHLQIGDKLVRLREAFDTLDTNRCGKISLADIRLAFRIHVHRELSQSDLRQIIAAHDIKGENLDEIMIDFDHFCCIVSEFKAKSPEQERAWDVFLGKASHFFHNLASPISRFVNWISSRPPRSVTPNGLNGRRGSSVRDVYLGGSPDGDWRDEIAVPMLKKSGFTFFKPQSSPRRLMPIEVALVDSSRVLLFVISRTSRSVSAMCEAAYYIGLGCNVVLCIQQMGEEVAGEALSKAALKDYNRGRAYLSDIANREGVPVFEDNVREAIECVIHKCKAAK